jgi:hypothetical protein
MRPKSGNALYYSVQNLVVSSRLLGRPRRRWVDIRMYLGEVGWGSVDGFGLAQDRDRWRALVNSVLNLRESIKCWETIEWLHNWWPL